MILLAIRALLQLRVDAGKFKKALSVILLSPVMVPSQTSARQLFAPIPQNQFASAVTVEQSRRLAVLEQQPTTKKIEIVKADPSALQDESVQFSFSGQPQLDFSKQSTEEIGKGSFIWRGRLAGVAGQAILVVREGAITGTVQGDRYLFQIEPIGEGVHAVITVDPSKFPPDEPPGFRKKEQEKRDRIDSLQFQNAPANQQKGPVGINLLVAYTPSAKASVADIEATIQLAVAEANTSYSNSGINIRLSLVDSFQFSYAESGKTWETILSDFSSNAEVNNRRRDSNADLSAVIINQPDFCGLAKDIMANASSAFAAVDYRCATGNYTLAHEIGHLMGARHDDKHDAETTPFIYGHGYQHPSPTASQAFRTVMAYACDTGATCDPRVPYWSSPDVHYKGMPTGTAANNNARVLNETAVTVATFRNQGRALANLSNVWAHRAADKAVVSGTREADNEKQVPKEDEVQSLKGEWLLGDSGEILRISQSGLWYHPTHGIAKIRKADDAADIKVFYESGSVRCSYRLAFSNGGNTVHLLATDQMQDPDFCPAGSIKRLGK